ncbi:hypothetical protein P8C59_008766 [Phyllachora maydis]|uniref:Uncharacterized protein n=1 Tax=Phyllachora maydis TaxID=1825666 RepID=A0AAD9ICH0_9PEZI|nr:hypothetical protein P8C59_008766 [Phyllachora maydis]
MVVLAALVWILALWHQSAISPLLSLDALKHHFSLPPSSSSSSSSSSSQDGGDKLVGNPGGHQSPSSSSTHPSSHSSGSSHAPASPSSPLSSAAATEEEQQEEALSWFQALTQGKASADKATDAAQGHPWDYSIKPLVFVFPGIYPMTKNEPHRPSASVWDMVRKAQYNPVGQQTIRPAESIGYYSLLDLEERRRYGDLVRQTGMYGIVFSHYWFGQAAMAAPLELMLQDGQPDVPFMLHWANHRWKSTRATRRAAKEQPEEADAPATPNAVAAWRRHFDWLLPFFRHPKYIRSNGKLQLGIHDHTLLGPAAQPMFDAFRAWTLAEGLGGLEMFEITKPTNKSEPNTVLDGLIELAPLASTSADGTTWPAVPRTAPIYHRGATAGWDATPRNRPGEMTRYHGWNHPSLWTQQLLRLMERIKTDPNPSHNENFLFVNSLNRWDQGSALEPSMQWGDAFGRAMKAAMEAQASIPWKQDLIVHSSATQKQIAADLGKDGPVNESRVDVCVLVRASRPGPAFAFPNGLPELFASLREQKNARWRAVVVPTTIESDYAELTKAQTYEAYDPRIMAPDIPESVYGPAKVNEFAVVDYVSHRLEQISPACASAEYILFARHDSVYTPTTFDLASSAGRNPGDIIGLNYATEQTSALMAEPASPAEYCNALLEPDGSDAVTVAARIPSRTISLEAVLLRQAKLRTNVLSIGRAVETAHTEAAFLARLVKQGWKFTPPADADADADADATARTPADAAAAAAAVDAIPRARPRATSSPAASRPARASVYAVGRAHLVGARTFPACAKVGNIWLHAPAKQRRYPSGCYTSTQLDMMTFYNRTHFDLEHWRASGFCLRLSAAGVQFVRDYPISSQPDRMAATAAMVAQKVAAAKEKEGADKKPKKKPQGKTMKDKAAEAKLAEAKLAEAKLAEEKKAAEEKKEAELAETEAPEMQAAERQAAQVLEPDEEEDDDEADE